MNPQTGDLWYGGPDGDIAIHSRSGHILRRSVESASDRIQLSTDCWRRADAAASDDSAPDEFALDRPIPWRRCTRLTLDDFRHRRDDAETPRVHEGRLEPMGFGPPGTT